MPYLSLHMIKKEYLYRTGANERVELTPDTLY